MRVLIVEDETKLAAILRRGLTRHGFAADVAATGEDAVWMASATGYQVIVLDVMLPGMDGFATCRQLRADGVHSPVLMLTALDAVRDRVTGLDSGADDYLAKPFAFVELLARLRALARRPGGDRSPELRVDDLQLDPASRQVRRGTTPIELTPKEFAILEALMSRAGQAISRYELLESAWDETYENRSNIVDVYVGQLRDKVDRPFGTSNLRTVRGVGYLISGSASGTGSGTGAE